MFTGDLSIADGDDDGLVYLALTGRYEPPLGPLGAAFDAVIGRRIAERCATQPAREDRRSIEADFSAVEARKSGARSRMATPLGPASSPPA